LKQVRFYYKQNTGNRGNVAQIFPEDYIFERLGELARVQSTAAKARVTSSHGP
jgi:hypothetical protein